MRVEKFEVPEENDNPFVTCDMFIRSSEGAYLLSADHRPKFEEALGLMFNTIQALENNEDLKEDFSFKIIEECVNFLQHLPKERPDTEDLVGFIKAFLHLAYNLNENLDKSEIVREKILSLLRYYDNTMTYVETLKLMSYVSNRIGHWRDWSPPSFRLSDHYYTLLKGE